MEKQIMYKVPKGKLLRIFLQVDRRNNSIKDISITGDFFAYPEEAIEELEKVLQKKPLERQVLIDTISSFVESHHVEFIGVDALSLSEAIMRGIA
ncbi:MAG: lipoate protein ligase C-terminal domain-containing protein [Thermoplasmatota archaeon]